VGNPSDRAGQTALLRDNRLPVSPRTPALPFGGRGSISGAQPKHPATELASATTPKEPPRPPNPSGPAPIFQGDRFGAEEPSSFDSRLTPVVPVTWPDEKRKDTSRVADAVAFPVPENSAPVAPVSSEITAIPGAEKELVEAASLAPSQTISVSLTPSGSSEHAFWDSPPKYSVPPATFFSESPRALPARRRSVLTKLLFVAIVCAVIVLLCYEISVQSHTP
jgi:hypothetical protein